MNLRPLLLVVLVWTGCYQFPGKPESLAGSQPHVIYVEPDEDRLLSTEKEFRLIVSEPLDPLTIHPESVWLLEGRISAALQKDPDALKRELEKGRVAALPIRLEFGESNQIIIVHPEEDFRSETAYTVVVTSAVLSTRRLSVKYFFKEYEVGSSEAKESPTAENRGPGPDMTETEKSPPTPGQEIDENLPDPEEDQTPDAIQGTVVINEIYYDAVGSDTDGIVFVELVGTAGLSLGRYQILFINGEDGVVKDSITMPEDAVIGPDGFYLIADARSGSPVATQVSEADLIDEFDPQNGPDAVQLLDPGGVLLDALGYGEGMTQAGENGLAMFESLPAPDVPSGHSLERVSPGQDTDNNAADFVERDVPTPRH